MNGAENISNNPVSPDAANEKKTPPADVFAGLDELFLLKRNRSVVRLLRDEEVLFEDDGFERCVKPPGKKARRRIACELAEVLEESEAESLLDYLDERGWNFKFSLAPRDLYWTYQPRWFFRFVQFGIYWLIILSPAAFVNPALVSGYGAAICGAATAVSLLVYLRIEERSRARRVCRREERFRQAGRVSGNQPYYCWMKSKDVLPVNDKCENILFNR